MFTAVSEQLQLRRFFLQRLDLRRLFVPATTQCLVQVHCADQLRQAVGDQCLLRTEQLTLRIEQAELARLQAGLPPALLAARILSRNQITAEALIGALDLGGLAEIRGQRRPHLAIIGFGSCAVTIAEETRMSRFLAYCDIAAKVMP